MSANAPHLERDDLAGATKLASDRLRLAAVQAEFEPVRTRTREAASLIIQLRGFIAAQGDELPPDLDQEVFAWLHANAAARKDGR